jgi:hypothetical protein
MQQKGGQVHYELMINMYVSSCMLHFSSCSMNHWMIGPFATCYITLATHVFTLLMQYKKMCLLYSCNTKSIYS